MAKIVFVVWPYLGSQIASMELADQLRKRGHTVCYMGLEDSESYITQYGFEFVSVFTKYFPKGFIKEWTEYNTTPFGIQYFSAFRRMGDKLRNFFEALLWSDASNDFQATLKKLKPDLVILASAQPEMDWIALLIYSINVKLIYLYDMLAPDQSTGLPPPTSSIIAANDLWTKLKITLAWQKHYLISYLVSGLFLLINGFHISTFSEKLARKYNYPIKSIPFYCRKRGIMRAPVLISFPMEFEFPGTVMPGHYYIGPSIFLDRKSCDFPWDRIKDGQPVIYCALGSILPYGKKRRLSNLFSVFIESSTVRPEWHWVLSVGNAMNIDTLGEIPPNITVVKEAPQIQMLKRATMMITHGGSNTVKECIYFGVPMIIVSGLTEPLAQIEIPAYEARVSYHGIGVSINIRKISSTILRNTIDAVDKDSYIRSQVKLMQTKVRKAEEECHDLKLVEAIIG